MKNHHHGNPIHPVAPKHPSHEEIACRAHGLWQELGQPADRDETTWLEAEAQLIAGLPVSPALPVSF